MTFELRDLSAQERYGRARRPFQAEGTALEWEQVEHVHKEEWRPLWLGQREQGQG